MSKSKKILLGIATIWPFLYMIIFFVFVFSQFLFISSAPNTAPDGLFGPMLIVFPLHILTMIISFSLLIYYIFHAYKNPAIEQDKKILWIILIFVANIIAMSIYWFLFIWKEPEPVITNNDTPQPTQQPPINQEKPPKG